MDFPVNVLPPLFISTAGRYCPSRTRYALSSSGAFQNDTGSPSSANMAQFIPLFIPFQYNMRRAFYMVGSSAGTANCDIGVYSREGARLFSTGSFALSGSTADDIKYITLNGLLQPGSYFLGISFSSTLASYFSSAAGAATNRISGIYQMASAFPLPDQATFATWAESSIPLFGITMTPSGW
jgi:hypothetical protein